MTSLTFPSPKLSHRRADLVVHIAGLALILIAGSLLVLNSVGRVEPELSLAVFVYLLCALASNLASFLYHFSPWHDRRKLLRRIDHAAIYPSITGTFTPFFIQANTAWTMTLLLVCWSLTVIAIWKKVTNENVKSRWSTASYLGLGAIGLSALPDLTNVPAETLYCVLAGALCYVVGTGFYARKTLPFRYAIWHAWVNLGGILMFVGIWVALLG
ncbi:PAQR family membrane homeostasis protein TrhA [Sulfitobacter mediterraneus]|uniref:PAQR family membrane homeostasis protein TrhA n=1 Tax=Sulfitobacter mediterraneus TaxID=83219 RepID=UPI0021A32081|nr:hemolysin III family protein [Sulfitobacter mediterraneus]UWR12341.1 hemolysin III family protein [Sulfitobacter mediterraneus]